MDTLPPGDLALAEDVRARLGLGPGPVTPLQGGSRNRSYRLSDGRRDVVLRVDGAHDDSYAVAREAEHAAQRLAAGHGLAPRLLLVGDRHAVSEFVPQPPWSRERACSVDGAAEAGTWIARLHGLPLTGRLRRVSFLASLEAYARQLPVAPEVTGLLGRGRRIATALGEFVPAFCHNDLHHLNLVGSNRGLMAVDWEYAGVGDPRLDLAGYLAYHELGDAAAHALAGAYGAHRGGFHREELEQARWLFEAVWWAWLELRRRIEGTEPDDIARQRARLIGRLEACDP